MIAKGIGAVGNNPEAIKNYLYDVKNYSGVSGSISFDANGDVKSLQYEKYVVKNGVPDKVN